MTAQEYLGQAYRLDQRINSKLDQVAKLNELATKCTVTLTGLPSNPNHGGSTMSDAIAKIIDLQAEINRDIDALVDIKSGIFALINSAGNNEHQLILEKRYLGYQPWGEIACDLNCTVSWVLKLHRKALRAIDETRATKDDKNEFV